MKVVQKNKTCCHSMWTFIRKLFDLRICLDLDATILKIFSGIFVIGYELD